MNSMLSTRSLRILLLLCSFYMTADTCLEEKVPTSETSYHDVLLWKGTKTKSMSEPMCLNDWRLVTRECQSNLEEGSKWLPFNYSACTKYQSTIKDSIIPCPKGFKLMDKNLCYINYRGKFTYEEAEALCRKQSSYPMDLKAINAKFLSILEPSWTYWVSERRPPECFTDNDYSILHEDHRKPRCITVVLQGGIPNYRTSRCKSTEKRGLVCINHPFLLLETVVFSRRYEKFSKQRSSYYLDPKADATWKEANKSCQAFPIKSTLMQSMRNLDDYPLFKVLMRELTPLSKDSSWWTDLLQEKDSLKWSSSPEEPVTFVDWETNTNFGMKEAGVVLIPDPTGESSIRWSLKDLSSKSASICEIQNLEYTHSTSVHIDAGSEAEYDEDFYFADLHCNTSGWFVSESITWFKDGVALGSGTSNNHRSLYLESPFSKHSAKTISEFQGYYWCSVDTKIPYKQIYSDKILAKIPDMHTFVLHIISEISNHNSCHDAHKLMTPFNEELGLHLQEIFFNESMSIVKDVKCIDSSLHIYNHVYISEDLGNEEELQETFENSFNSENKIFSLR